MGRHDSRIRAYCDYLIRGFRPNRARTTAVFRQVDEPKQEPEVQHEPEARQEAEEPAAATEEEGRQVTNNVFTWLDDVIGRRRLRTPAQVRRVAERVVSRIDEIPSSDWDQVVEAAKARSEVLAAAIVDALEDKLATEEAEDAEQD